MNSTPGWGMSLNVKNLTWLTPRNTPWVDSSHLVSLPQWWVSGFKLGVATEYHWTSDLCEELL